MPVLELFSSTGMEGGAGSLKTSGCKGKGGKR